MRPRADRADTEPARSEVTPTVVACRAVREFAAAPARGSGRAARGGN
jgi:hypothetical protein